VVAKMFVAEIGVANVTEKGRATPKSVVCLI